MLNGVEGTPGQSKNARGGGTFAVMFTQQKVAKRHRVHLSPKCNVGTKNNKAGVLNEKSFTSQQK